MGLDLLLRLALSWHYSSEILDGDLIPMNKEMLTTDDLTRYLHINKNPIYRLIKGRKLPATRVTGKWLFPRQLVEEWVTNSAKEGN
jgi:putative molybdopterin biosynthesis protein